MAMKLKITKRALKVLKKLPARHHKVVSSKAASLTGNPYPTDSIKLQGATEFYRVKAGDFRIIYTVDEAGNLVIVTLIGKRNDDEIYRQFSRLQ